jgi:UDP-N-acetylmuramoyl-tripeptide--D-alanyl-D-alanine ligase
MNKLSLSQIAALAGGVVASGKADAMVERVSTDSRTVKRGELFVALRGEHFDGHKFVKGTFQAGAAGAMVDESWNGDVPRDFCILRVKDTLIGYQSLAANYRKSLNLKVVGLTGSNGKTSTKDFTAAVLTRRFNVTKTEGNFNNHVGLPRTILEAKTEHEVAVWELGMNHAGEIAALARIAAPDAGIITNIGVAHIEFFGSLEAIAREKGQLAAVIPPTGWLVLNAQDQFTPEIEKMTQARVIRVGIESGAIYAGEIRQTPEGAEFTILEGAHRCRAQLPVPGLHMVQNALLAVAAGRAFGLSLEECAEGLAAAPLTKARLQIKTIHGVQFLDDSYNANPDSMKAALRTLIELDAEGKRIAVLGEMGELGAEAESGHGEVGEEAATLGVNHLIAIGQLGALIAKRARECGLQNSVAVASTKEAADLLADLAEPGDLVLIKGSRLARTERVLEEFAAHQPTEGITR